jgi:photosystem II stability/assembly factor-like uncharacterized protein
VKRISVWIALLAVLLAGGAHAAAPADRTDKAGKKAEKKKEDQKKDPLSAGTFAGLPLRSIGPAVTSGRVVDLAVDPKTPDIWYVATAGGGVWKTTTHGVSWTPVFDAAGSYSVGCVTIDPHDSLVVWVGSGENNSQRSVSYGDGVYKSVDGGKTWTNMGLKNSEHIAKILVDPRNSDAVFVAAQGPLWSSGGDRGLYKTTDGGKTWKAILTVDENTGVTDIVMDPRNPDVLYAASYQRQRKVWTLVDGGPGSAIYKSRDGGATWSKLTAGLPKEDMGRIGLTIAPASPNVVYATIEAREAGGFYRSQDAGASWEKRSSSNSSSAQYYQELFPHPTDTNTVYLVDTLLKVTNDGGKTFRFAGEKNKHVDNHVVWIDPANPAHLLVGCDGGLYESYDTAATWEFKANLPITQFYRVDVDYGKPFYYVYGGTQDNYSLGGPSRTNNTHGITNSDWFVTVDGDGFKSVVDPQDPNFIYAEAQYGAMVRFDRKSGEAIDIQPQPGLGEPALRFNWDSPILISPHSHTRLYFAAQKLFRSDDRGNTWRAVSPDLTRQLDRNKLKIMGRIWNIDAVAKNASTSLYGNIVSLAESPLKEGLLYVGTDDGLVQVSEDGGGHWRKIDRFPGVPDNTYVSRLEASPKDADTVFAAFDNHQNGDFKPYLLKSTDRGRSWTSIAGDLPQRGTVFSLVQDHVNPDLLFTGTEFGLYFSIDSGRKWIQLTGNLPISAMRDLVIQKREDDLAVATFGRGFYILDDYSPLRMIKPETLQKEFVSFPVKQAWMYNQSSPLGLEGKGFQGEGYYTAPNPPFGAVFTYYLKDDLKSLRKQRVQKEKEVEKEGGEPPYPTWQELQAEAREQEPVIIATVQDAEGNVVRRGTGPVTAGLHRVTWDLRYPPSTPVSLAEPVEDNPFDHPPQGPMAVPGKYTVSFAKRVDGKTTPLGEPQTFSTVPLGLASLPAEDRPAVFAFQEKTARLQRAVFGAVQLLKDTQERLRYIQRAVLNTTKADQKLIDEADTLKARLDDVDMKLNGNPVIRAHNEADPPSIVERVSQVVSGHWSSSSAPTQTHMENYRLASQAFAPVLEELRKLVEVDLKNLENKLESAGAPWTPGRVPVWKPE